MNANAPQPDSADRIDRQRSIIEAPTMGADLRICAPTCTSAAPPADAPDEPEATGTAPQPVSVAT